MNFACRAGIAIVAALASSPPRSEPPDADHHTRHDPADRDHRVVSAPAVVRLQPAGALVQDDARRFAVPRAVSRRGRGDHQRAGSGRSRHRHRRRQPVRPRGRRQVLVLLPDRAAGRRQRPPRHLARLDGAARRGTAARKNPVGGAGGVSAGGRHRKTDPRPARIHRDLAGRAAPDRQAGQVRRDLRPRPRQHAVGRALPRRQGADPRSVRHHERRVQGAGRRRLPGDPGRGAAPSRHDDAARLQGQRPRIPDRGVQPPARRGRGRDLGALLLGQPEPAARLLDRCRATSAPCRTCCN